ncbi:putative transcription factor GRF family [Medicago truncatula]|uniref:GRF zinc finger protein n=1 Tax=Medicago truncatula TaxID=3880 RepID=Q2HVL9_MEDTR|nr:uncharacterized protein At4g04775 [Medicago truncatula]ABD28428.1 Zinc finger, GRF-type [Medicago truncatula]AES80871.1 GRF zinc finger protein [Medicago truncatula]AFK36564.1 unknown [Medicago truncatula]RHN47490.1 putative transcription factor GRF family [Medicago truncatula]
MTSRVSAAPTCDCEAKCVIFISRTKKNPDRPFFRCPYYGQIRKTHCDYFMWEDDFIASQAAMVELQETTIERKMEAMIIQMNKDMKAMKIQINKDMEAKINELKRDTEYKFNILEREIEAMTFQISADVVAFDIKHLSLGGLKGSK